MTPSVPKLVGGLTLAVFAISTAALLILLADGFPPLVIAAGRVVITALGLFIIGRRGLPGLRRALVEHRRLRWDILLAAALLALHFATWIASLSLTTVLRSMSLVAMQPIFAGLLGRFVGDRVSARLYVGAGIALCGTAVLAGPAVLESSEASLWGDILAVVGGFAAAAYLAVGRSVRGRVELTGYLATVHLLAGAMLWTVVVVVHGTGVAPWLDWNVDLQAVLAVVGLGLVPGILGHGVLNWAVRHVPVHVVSLVILIEPLSATALVAVVLGTDITALDALGAAILLAGVGVGLRASSSGD